MEGTAILYKIRNSWMSPKWQLQYEAQDEEPQVPRHQFLLKLCYTLHDYTMYWREVPTI